MDDDAMKQAMADLSEKYRYQDEHSAMLYSKFNTNLSDIDEKMLENMNHEVKNLSIGSFPASPFPVDGIVHGPNMRLMVPLVLKKQMFVKDSSKPDSKILNVWFLVDTTSLYTCLSVKTLEAFVGVGNVNQKSYHRFKIQDPGYAVECMVSKVGSDFEHVNILGMNAMEQMGFSPIFNLRQGNFRLIKTEQMF